MQFDAEGTLIEDVARLAHEHRRKVEREEGEWLAARIHRAAHGEWFKEDCEVCERDEIELLRTGAPEFNGTF